MGKLERSVIAHFNSKRSIKILVDSAVTHHFFYSRSFFTIYDKFEAEKVKSESVLSTIVEKVQVWFPIDGGMYAQAYPTLHLSTNIFSVGLLSKNYNIEFTTDLSAWNGMSTCFITNKQAEELAKTIEIIEALFPIPLVPVPQRYAKFQAFKTQTEVCPPLPLPCSVCCHKVSEVSQSEIKEDLKWHYRTGHSAPGRHQKLSMMFPDVIDFSRRVLEDIVCVPRSMSEASKGSIQKSSRLTMSPLEVLHVDITGRMRSSSLVGMHYDVGFVDDFTAKSDVSFFDAKADTYKAMVYYR